MKLKRLVVLAVLLQMSGYVCAQQMIMQGDIPVNPNQDVDIATAKEKDYVSRILRELKNGAVIVRLKTNQKSIEAYRKAGRDKVAERMEEERQKQNRKMYRAFMNNFLFCKVFFIYSHETQLFLNGNKKIFLNEKLQHDTTIVFTDSNYVFCEYGSVEAYSKFKDYSSPILGNAGVDIPDGKQSEMFDAPTQTSTAPATTSGLFFLDKNLGQLSRPFPYVVGVYMDNYDAPVRALNKDLERVYMRLVIDGDFKKEMKEQRKKERQKRKESPKYNPFK